MRPALTTLDKSRPRENRQTVQCTEEHVKSFQPVGQSRLIVEIMRCGSCRMFLADPEMSWEDAREETEVFALEKARPVL
jgi:hypothetical protein